MPRTKLKKSADSLITFRINTKDKKVLEALLHKKAEKLNKYIQKDEYLITKNELFLSAVMLGLEQIEYSDLPKRRKKTR